MKESLCFCIGRGQQGEKETGLGTHAHFCAALWRTRSHVTAASLQGTVQNKHATFHTSHLACQRKRGRKATVRRGPLRKTRFVSVASASLWFSSGVHAGSELNAARFPRLPPSPRYETSLPFLAEALRYFSGSIVPREAE